MRLMTRSSLKITATTFVGSLLAVSAALVAVQASRAGGTAYLRCPIWVTLPSANAHTSVSYIPRGVAVGPTRARVTANVAPAVGAIVVVQYGRGSSYLACSAGEQASPSGAQDMLVKGLLPDTSYRFRVVAKTRSGVAFGSARTLRTLPAGHVPQGVEVGSLAVGGMSNDQVRAVLGRPLETALRISYAGAFWDVSRAKVGARLDLRRTVTAALTASPGALLSPLSVTVDPASVRSICGVSRGAVEPRWYAQAGVTLAGTHAVVTPVQGSVVIQTRKMVALITHQLITGNQGAIPLAVVRKPPPNSGSLALKAVVVRIGSQTLTAYLYGRAVRETPVTTGRPALPTPVGSYFVHYRASPYTFISPWPPGSPYYYPPAPVTWAMYFFDNDFLHDDPAEPSDAFGARLPTPAPTLATRLYPRALLGHVLALQLATRRRTGHRLTDLRIDWATSPTA